MVAINFPCFGASPQRFFCVLFFAELRVKLTLHLSPLFFSLAMKLDRSGQGKVPNSPQHPRAKRQRPLKTHKGKIARAEP